MPLFSRSSSRNHRQPRRPNRGLSEEAVLLLASLFIAITANRGFLAGALKGRDSGDASAWGLGLALGLALVCIHYLLMALLAHRWTFKPVLALALVVAALASHYVTRYNVYLDPSMLRNVLRTDLQEARELIGAHLLVPLLLQAALPIALLWWLPVLRRTWLRAISWRVGSLLLAVLVLVATVLLSFQTLSSLMRNQKELRYLITPANLVWSLASVAGFAARQVASGPKKPIGLDAQLGPAWASRKKPTLLVLVVGETARAANWGLTGYARQTTPELAKLPLLSFPYADACGTNTEVSLPCMFAPVGRRDYDEARIRGSETLLHVLARAGVGVLWVDNQSGCKGVCDGLPNTSVVALAPPGLCAAGRCFDEGLLQPLPGLLGAAKPAQNNPKNAPRLLVLHMLGNHGPSYFRRIPPAFARFKPFCESDDLRLCSVEQIVNAYDNALLYTDHVLAQLIGQLQAAAGTVDSAVVYVSDHGESLGENNLFLHGIPYAIAPDVQTKVPMLMWFSAGYGASLGFDTACLARRAKQPAHHDHLFHTVLGLLDVQTAVREMSLDLINPCRLAQAKP